jgi:regulator of sigma E protease
MNAIISFILVLGILIFVHELGHFLLAKFFGVRVLQFSLGFGRKLIGKTFGETEYLISAFPLGGYVKMHGEQPGEEISEEGKAGSFAHKSAGQRFWIVFAGPLFNLMFAVLIFWLMFMLVGMPGHLPPVIDQVVAGSAAEQAGLRPGDTVLDINGLKIKAWVQIPALVSGSQGRKMELTISRNNGVLTVTAVPELTKLPGGDEKYLLGIKGKETGSLKLEKKSPFPALVAAFVETWELIEATFDGIIMMCRRLLPASELGGPIRIAEIAGEQLKAGWLNLIYFTALLSVNLGVLNLLPIPVLDGGHLVFLGLETIRRKPFGEAAQLRAQQVGMALLGTLMIFVFYNDIARIVQRWLAAS